MNPEQNPALNQAALETGNEEVVVTANAEAGTPGRADTHQEPIHAADMPKTGMHIPHPASTDEVFDCIIIGGGPTGLFAAFYAGMREMSVKIVDSLGELGGQVSALYPEKFIYDVAGFPAIKGKDLVAGCVEQGLQFGPTVCLGEKVEALEKQADGTFVLTTDKHVHRTRTIIVAAGVGAFAPRKLPSVTEKDGTVVFDATRLDPLEGQCVFYFVKALEQFRDKRLLIVGGGDSAMDWAMGLEPIAKQITLIHRRDKWRAHEDSVNKVLRSSVDVRVFHEVRKIEHDGVSISGVTIFHNKSQDETHLELDTLIMCLGFIANLGPIRNWGLDILDGGIAVDTTMATTIPGIYAAGDVVRYNGKLNLIATGYGEAAIAANYCKNFIDPTSRVFPGHSSEKSA